MTSFIVKFIRTLLFFYFISYSYTIDHDVLNSFFDLSSYVTEIIVAILQTVSSASVSTSQKHLLRYGVHAEKVINLLKSSSKMLVLFSIFNKCRNRSTTFIKTPRYGISYTSAWFGWRTDRNEEDNSCYLLVFTNICTFIVIKVLHKQSLM